jgi:hypothetical protein
MKNATMIMIIGVIPVHEIFPGVRRAIYMTNAVEPANRMP